MRIHISRWIVETVKEAYTQADREFDRVAAQSGGSFLTPRDQPSTVNKQWPPLRKSHMSRHTRFNTGRKTETVAMHGLFLGTNTVYRSIRLDMNPI